MNKERLLRLADFLDGLKPDQFDIRDWVSVVGKDGTVGGCGTVACAIGWATTLPEFREAGLQLKLDTESPGGRIVFRLYTGFHAISEFFNIHSSDALRLFFDSLDADHYPVRPVHVANAIRNYVRIMGEGSSR